MFSAPYRDAAKAISETGRLGDLNPTPWAFMLGNAFGWISYSILIDNLFILFANTPGFLLSVWLNLVAVKLQYENHKSAEMRKSMIRALQNEEFSRRTGRRRSTEIVDEESAESFIVTEQKQQPQEKQQQSFSAPQQQPASGVDLSSNEDSPVLEQEGRLGTVGDYARIIWEVAAQHEPVPVPHERLVLGIVFYWTVVIATITFGKEALGQDKQEAIVGIAVNLNLVFLYGAPLSTIVTVLKERNSATIHIPTIVTLTANGVFWFAFGLAVIDLYIIVPNGLGAILGVIQMILCVIFPRKKKGDGIPLPAALASSEDDSSSLPPSAATTTNHSNDGEEPQAQKQQAGKQSEEHMAVAQDQTLKDATAIR